MRVADTTAVDSFLHVQEKLGEMVIELELFRAAYYGGEAMARQNPNGVWSVHQPAVAAATQSMAQLNRIPAVIAGRNGVRAATDITGFGLAGHACAVARQSGITLEIRAGALPLLPSARELAAANQPGGLQSNRREFGPAVRFAAAIDPDLEALLFDPQTSGGLLLLVPPANEAAVLSELPHARAIGVARAAGDHPIVVV